VTPRRLSAARGAVRRETAAVALFPELARWRTPEERIADMDARADAYAKHMDTVLAEMEREAVERWNKLTYEQQGAVAQEWLSTKCPRGIEYFLDVMWTTMQKEA
jgi:hypothetical protein